MDMAMVTVIMDVAGGVHHIIILHVGVVGTGVQGLMDSMEIISMYIIMCMSTTQTMYTGIRTGFQARV